MRPIATFLILFCLLNEISFSQVESFPASKVINGGTKDIKGNYYTSNYTGIDRGTFLKRFKVKYVGDNESNGIENILDSLTNETFQINIDGKIINPRVKLVSPTGKYFIFSNNSKIFVYDLLKRSTISINEILSIGYIDNEKLIFLDEDRILVFSLRLFNNGYQYINGLIKLDSREKNIISRSATDYIKVSTSKQLKNTFIAFSDVVFPLIDPEKKLTVSINGYSDDFKYAFDKSSIYDLSKMDKYPIYKFNEFYSIRSIKSKESWSFKYNFDDSKEILSVESFNSPWTDIRRNELWDYIFKNKKEGDILRVTYKDAYGRGQAGSAEIKIDKAGIQLDYQDQQTHIYDLERVLVFGKYKDEIQGDFSKIPPKDEFETDSEASNRIKNSKDEIMRKYENIFNEERKMIVKKIQDSYQSIIPTLGILGNYIPEKEEFPITIMDKLGTIKVPRIEAREFKARYSEAKVTADKQLDEGGIVERVFNIKVVNPVTGSIYPFGEQMAPLYVDLNKVKTDESGIPIILVTAELQEPSGNKLIDGNEKCNILVKLKNTGNGNASDVRINMNASSDAGINYEKATKLTGIAPGQTQEVLLKVQSDRSLINGNLTFNINITEARNFNPAPLSITVGTQEFKKPILSFIEAGIKEVTGNNNSIIENNEMIEVTALVQNKGQGESSESKVLITISDPNIIALNPSKLSQEIGSLNPGESKVVNFQFSVNNEYRGDMKLPIKITLSEKFNEYGGQFPLGLEMQKVSLATQNIKVDGQYDKSKTIEDVSLTSEVDKNIPETELSYSNRYALIIGNENYSKKQTGLNSESDVAFAVNDALTFKKYSELTLGVPKENIQFLPDATSEEMEQAITKFTKLSELSNGEAELIFYYAGHGFPDEETKEAYLVPVNVTGANIKKGIKLSSLYQDLTKNPAKRVTVFLDACFSGGGRNSGLLEARGVKIKPKSDIIPSGTLVAFTATSNDQSALPYKEKQHGLFTYYLLKKLQETKGDVSYKDLAQYIKSEVQLSAVKVNSKEQTPTIVTSPEIQIDWVDFKILRK